eukprot:gb/GECH01009914.1/.p1 GENE.gb/GECH01009914.1/~~gb/GECH01009914.1/.p1  ORF type:complete len:493 (+),score=126.30 gb/GECH01009914.1/:1-1479(+)
MNSVHDQRLVQISTRPWLFSLSKKYNQKITQLSDVPHKEYLKLRDKGFNMLWMMGIWKLGSHGLEFDRQHKDDYAQHLPDCNEDDIIGSPYAIVDYVCNPELGSNSDILQLKKFLNSIGMELMLDFVPNHTAVDCEWVNQDPNMYVRAPPHEIENHQIDPNVYLPSAQGIAYGGGDWKDTAQLNYWNSKTIDNMKENLLRVASLCDAIRCDMAMLVLNNHIQSNWGYQLEARGFKPPLGEFWEDAISHVKQKYPHVKFLAECYGETESRLQELGFDFTYDKAFYDILRTYHLDNIRGYLENNSLKYLKHSAHFTENHDEPTAVTAFDHDWQKSNMATLICMTIPGMKFFHEPQLSGYENRLEIHLRRSATEPSNPYVVRFTADLLEILSHESGVFGKGEWKIHHVHGDDGWRFLCWKWELGNERRLVIVNYSDQTAGGVIPDLLQSSSSDLTDRFSVQDLLTGDVFFHCCDDIEKNGLGVMLRAWTAQILKY